MINLIANEQLKTLGCKWNGTKWEAPKLAQDEFNAINKKFYEDLIIVEITTCENENLKSKDWGYSHARLVAGYIVAYAKGRDSGAVTMQNIAVVKGRFTSGGSMKNYICKHDDVVLRLEVSANCLDLLDEEVREGRYNYRIISELPTKNELEKYTTEELLAEIKRRG